MFSSKKINNQIIKPIETKKLNSDEILGYDLFQLLFCNIFLVACKNSGKTTTINHIIHYCINKFTKVFIFCSTHNNDDNYKFIKKELEKREINAAFYDSVENLKEVVAYMQENEIIEEEEKELPTEKLVQIIKITPDTETSKVNIKVPKKKSPSYLIIFDDVSTELKTQNVTQLLKTFRHFKSKVIVSSQWPSDLAAGGRNQIDYWLLWRGYSEKKLQQIYDDIGNISIDFPTFYNLYRTVTDKEHQFLYIDKKNNIFRKNFNEEIKIKVK